MQNTNFNKQEAIQFKQSIAPLETITLREPIKADGTIEEITVRFYTGQEGDLRARPYILKRTGALVDLVTYVGELNYLSGENDTLVFDVSMAVQKDDKVCVEFQNVDANFPYTGFLTAKVDYYGGTKRVV